MKTQEEHKIPAAETPYRLLSLKQRPAKTWAAGIPAVMSSIRQLWDDDALLRGAKALFKMNQQGGFDCPSCAWPDPDDERSPLGEYCENGAKSLAEEATSKKVDASFFQEHSVFELAQLSDYEIGKLGRLAEPLYLPKGATHYQAISWKDAFAKIADHLNVLESPDEAAFYTSGRTSNEASFVYQLFVREFGTNNFPDCSNMCHETSGYALTQAIGIGKGTVTLDDFNDAELIVDIGHNPGTNAPRMLSALEKAKKNGAKIIAINPLPEAGLLAFKNPQNAKGILGNGIKLSDCYLPVKINGDMALLKALGKMLLDFEKSSPGEVFNHSFIKEKTVGFDEYIAQFDSYNLDELAVECGVPLPLLYDAAQMMAFKKRIIICWGMGLTQQPNGVAMIQEIVNLLLLKGSIGIKGGGLCPVRGHSNVQGNRTMLINNNPTQAQLDSIKAVFGFEPPRKVGYDVVESIRAIHEGKVKVMFSMGGNFLSATPDTNYTAEALRKLKLTVLVSIKPNRSHFIHGEEALILPTLSRSDEDIVAGVPQMVSTENSMGVVQSSKGVLKPISEHLINETQIASRMAMATLGSKSKVDWKRYHDSYDAVRNDIEKTIPGFENYNERIRTKSGFYLPNAAKDKQEFHIEATENKARFTLSALPSNELEPDEYLMSTTRTHDQFNTVIYGLDDRYRGIYNERRVVMMNEKDIALAGFKDQELVDLFNYDDGVERIAPLFKVVSYPIPEKCTTTYFPETNVLISINNTVDGSNMPASKYVKIKIKKHQQTIFQKIEENRTARTNSK